MQNNANNLDNQGEVLMTKMLHFCSI